jgi:hypothetical protein
MRDGGVYSLPPEHALLVDRRIMLVVRVGGCFFLSLAEERRSGAGTVW